MLEEKENFKRQVEKRERELEEKKEREFEEKRERELEEKKERELEEKKERELEEKRERELEEKRERELEENNIVFSSTNDKEKYLRDLRKKIKRSESDFNKLDNYLLKYVKIPKRS